MFQSSSRLWPRHEVRLRDASVWMWRQTAADTVDLSMQLVLLSLSKDAQEALSPATSTSSSRGIPKM